MNKVRWVSATAGAAMVAATLALPGAGVAYASVTGGVTGNGNVSLLSGNSVSAPVSAPVNLCGLSFAVLGFSNSGCVGGASSSVVSPSSGGGAGRGNGNVSGDGNVSAVSGNTVSAPVSAPVNICGVSAAVGGFADSHCAGGASTRVTEPAGGVTGSGNVMGHGNLSVLSGNSVSAPVSAPVNLCGISLALLGFADSACHGGAVANPPPAPPACEGGQCTPPGCQCHPPACHGDQCTPPGCQGNCTPAGPGTPPQGTGTGTSRPGPGPGNQGTPPQGTGPGNQGTTTALSAATIPGSRLPTTGADLLLLGAAALGSIGVGAGTVALARRRRNGEVA